MFNFYLHNIFELAIKEFNIFITEQGESQHIFKLYMLSWNYLSKH